MTDPMPPPDDEIVSAVLDGEATADERARVESDRGSRERLAHFEEVRRQVAAPVPVPADARERALAAALTAFDASTATEPAPPTEASPMTADTEPPRTSAAPVDELAARRARPKRGLQILAAAAAIVVVLIGVGAVVRTSNQADTLATSAPARQNAEVSSAAPESADQNESEAVSGDQPVTTTAPPSGVLPSTAPTTTSTTETGSGGADPATAARALELGTVRTDRELRTLVLARLDDQAGRQQSGSTNEYDPAAVAGGPAFVSCADLVRATDPEVGAVLVSADATYQGEAAIVLAFAIDRVAHPAANGSVRIYALAADTCAPLSVQTVR